jgi:thioredoxin
MNLSFLAAAMISLAAPGNASNGQFDDVRANFANDARLTQSGYVTDDGRPGYVADYGAVPNNDTVLLDFRADWCGPCRMMDPVVSSLMAEGLPVRRVNIDQERDLANRFGVQSIPCFVLLVNGHEVDRVVGATDRSRLDAMFSRNGVGAAVTTARGQSPGLLPPASAIPFPTTDRNSLPTEPIVPVTSSRLTRETSTQHNPPSTFDSAPPPYDSLIRASARLRIEDDHGISVGSGTIIDARSGEALIITCGHMFRDAAKDGKIWVDLFGPAAPQAVEGKLIDYDLKSEVGLVRITTTYPVKVARLAPAGYVVRSGDQVISVGCDGGADATARETHVTSINRYAGAANLEVAFQPVQGRSGGGLFTPDGLIVGVCYAADPEAKEGLFTALPALCDELEHVGLSFVCENSVGSRLRAADVGLKPKYANSTVDRQLQPVAMTTTALAERKMPTLTPDEMATLQVLRDEAQGAEVICIVRPKDNPQAEKEIIVLDHASPAFLDQLDREQLQMVQRQSPPTAKVDPR